MLTRLTGSAEVAGEVARDEVAGTGAKVDRERRSCWRWVSGSAEVAGEVDWKRRSCWAGAPKLLERLSGSAEVAGEVGPGVAKVDPERQSFWRG